MSQRDPKWLAAARVANATGGDWLGRALPRAGILPPGEVDAALAADRIRVDGAVVRDPLTPIGDGQRVELDGVAVSLAAPTHVLMFHKPVGLIVAATDPEGQGTVFDALTPLLSAEQSRFGWHAVGRLDRATTGLLLFTNDERLVAHVTSPESELTKTYVATTDGKVKDDQIAALLAGVQIDDGPAQATSAKRRGPREIEVVISEGRHHQVRRMLNAVRLGIRTLHREAIGGLVLDVPVGELRLLTAEDVETRLSFVVHDAGRIAVDSGLVGCAEGPTDLSSSYKAELTHSLGKKV